MKQESLDYKICRRRASASERTNASHKTRETSGGSKGWEAKIFSAMIPLAMIFLTPALAGADDHQDQGTLRLAQAGTSSSQLPPSAGDVVENKSALQDIVVTARKREERLQDVPVAIDVFTAKDIKQYATQDFRDIAAQTPGLVIGGTENTNGGTINLRGIGSSDNSATVDQAVSINVDGIQVSTANVIRVGQYDLDRIEILKGPQALFFGKNSPGGVISLVSADPTDTFESKVRTGYEFYNQQEFVEAMVSGRLTDTLKARFDVYGSRQLGWFHNEAGTGVGPAGPYVATTLGDTYPNSKDGFGRLTLIFDPYEKFDLKFKLSADRTDIKNGPSNAVQSYGCTPFHTQTGYGAPDPEDCVINRTYVHGNVSPGVAATDHEYGDGAPTSSSSVYLASLTANYRPTTDLTLTSVTGYFQDHDFDFDNFCQSNVSCLAAATNQTERQYTEELRVASSWASPLNFFGGVYYQYVEYNDFNPVSFGEPISPVPLLYDNTFLGQRTHSFSVFAQGIYDFAPLWELTAGARYTTETKAQENTRGPSVLNGFAPYGPLDLALPDLKFSNISPEATLTFKPSTDMTAYATYRQGYLSGGFNLVAFLAADSDNSFKPETVRGGEVGLKGVLFDRQLRFNADVYYYKYANLQLSTFDPVTLSLPVRNAGEATIYGPEASLIYAPARVEGLTLRGSIAYNHAHYDEFISDCYTGQSIAAGCNLNLAGGAFNSESLAGRPLVRAPAWSGNIGASFEHAVGNNLEIGTSVDANYTDSYFTQPEEDPRSEQSAFWKVDAQVSLHRSDRGWEVALIGKNLSNKLDVTGTFSTTFTGGGTGTNNPKLPDLEGQVGLPRTVILQFTFTEALFKSSHQ